MSKNPFTRQTLSFLGQLAKNNRRDWFEAHRDQYEAVVREPALEFIRIMAAPVAKVSPHLRVSDSKVGGSLMRIHRDVRFSKDKSPYKTNVGIQFRHEAGKDVHAPGLYVHLDPKDCFLGAGMWQPESKALAQIRRAIDADGAAWKRVRDGKRFRGKWSLEGASLKRPPRGYDADHPYVEDLMRKDFIAAVHLKRDDVLAPDFPQSCANLFQAASGFLAFLAGAIEVEF